MEKAPFPAPTGFVWVFVATVWNVKAKRHLHAKDYGKRAWCILVRARR